MYACWTTERDVVGRSSTHGDDLRRRMLSDVPRMGSASDSMPTLSGAEEVPAVNTQASGINRIAVIGDKTVTGSVEVRNLDATAAHIHLAPKGQNGPVIIPLVKTGENVWSVPPNTMLSSAQFDAFRSGNLYVNVHSAANPNGEIRAQLKP